MIPAGGLANLSQARPGIGLIQTFPIQNIPGIGPIQVVPASAFQSQQSQPSQTIQGVPLGTQIIRKCAYSLTDVSCLSGYVAGRR